jgi:hypothetical protein
MKKLILAAFAVTCAVGVFAQGTIVFNNRIGAAVLQTHVYAPQAGATTVSQIGNGAGDFEVGTTSWAGWTAIGANGLTGQYGASTTFAQLLTAPGANAAESSLVAQTPVITFRTGAGAGFTMGGTTVTSSNVGADSIGTWEMVVWDNSSGNYATWTEAFPAWQAGLIAAGESGRFNATFGGTGTPPNLVGLTSFNMYTIGPVPEPTTFALAGLGLAAMLVLRRRK